MKSMTTWLVAASLIVAATARAEDDYVWRYEYQADEATVSLGASESDRAFVAHCVSGAIERMLILAPPVDVPRETLGTLQMRSGTEIIAVRGTFAPYPGDSWVVPGSGKHVDILSFAPATDQREAVLRFFAKVSRPVTLSIPGVKEIAGMKPLSVPINGAKDKFKAFIEFCR